MKLQGFLPYLLVLNLLFTENLYLELKQSRLSFNAVPVISREIPGQYFPPISIKIPSLDLNLNLETGKIENGLWITSDTTATHLESSAFPGEKSNIVIYGHNKFSIFGRLKELKTNDEIVVKTQDGKNYLYQVEDIKVADPNMVELVEPTDHEVLTVYTCTGLFDSKRLVIKARPVGVSS